MDQSQELSKALEELTRATGVALDIHIQPEASKEKIDEAIRRFVLFVLLIKRSITRIIFC